MVTYMRNGQPVEFYNYGDIVTLKTGKQVRINSIDFSRKVFDYLVDYGPSCDLLEAKFNDIAA